MDAAAWWSLDDAMARRLASRIAESLGARLVEVRPHAFGDRRGRVALFEVDGELFAFVPGGDVVVGYDGASFVPTQQQKDSFAMSVAESGVPDDIHAFVDAMTSALRTAAVPSLLVAVAAKDAFAVAVAPDDERIVEMVSNFRDARAALGTDQPRKVTFSGEAGVILGEGWTVEKAWLVEVASHRDEVDRLALRSQRLLSPEEWEHACGAGVSTLFRWGDAQPPGRPHPAVSGPHLLPNVFGLEIGQNPFQDERTADPDAVRGGDGGRMACGNVGDFVEWLTLATAFRDPYYEAWLKEQGNGVDKMMVRAAIPVG